MNQKIITLLLLCSSISLSAQIAKSLKDIMSPTITPLCVFDGLRLDSFNIININKENNLLKGKVGPSVIVDSSVNLLLYFIDGLRLNNFSIKEIPFELYCIRKIKKNAYFQVRDSTGNFDGKIEIFTKSLIDLDGLTISKSKDKVNILSKLEIKNVESISFVKKKEARLLYGREGRFGAIIIKIKKE